MRPPPLVDPITPDVIRSAEDLLAFKWYFAGCFALLFWDFFLTLDDEVEWIWKGKKATMFYVFLIVRPSSSFIGVSKLCDAQNRYCPPAFCIITLFAYFSPLWSYENKYLFTFLVSIILVECTVVFYAMSLPGTNDALVLPNVPIDSFHVCILYSDPAMDTAYLSTSIAFDCIVFATTLACTMNHNIQHLRSSILPTIRWDGTLYFCVILSGNVVWMALAINTRPGLKLMNAQPSMYLTSIMINRLTISVRKAAAKLADEDTAIELPTQIFSCGAVNNRMSRVNPTFAETSSFIF
ncbi:hypothetical protein B0H13DRAFT_2351803 [Mycena leptocephala]|nr:hypothetical protein B0H13DRAFT_2351803 [Mycena leptocephala]